PRRRRGVERSAESKRERASENTGQELHANIWISPDEAVCWLDLGKPEKAKDCKSEIQFFCSANAAKPQKNRLFTARKFARLRGGVNAFWFFMRAGALAG